VKTDSVFVVVVLTIRVFALRNLLLPLFVLQLVLKPLEDLPPNGLLFVVAARFDNRVKNPSTAVLADVELERQVLVHEVIVLSIHHV